MSLQGVLVEAVCSGSDGNWVDIRLLVLSPVVNDGQSRYRLSENILP
jgi:hypothetical protein